MHAVLAFSNRTAADPRQRARCVRTGRFVSWSRAAALRLPGAPVVVVLTPAPVAQVETPAPSPVVVVADAPALVVVAEASPLRARVSRVASGFSRWGRRVAAAAAVVVATALGTVPGASQADQVDQVAALAQRGNQADREATPLHRRWTM